MIENLNQLKRVFQDNPRFEIIDHWKGDCIGEVRKVVAVNTVSFHSVVDGQPEHKNSLANGGKGVVLWWEKAADWSFNDGICSVYFKGKEHVRENLIMSFRLLPEEVA